MDFFWLRRPASEQKLSCAACNGNEILAIFAEHKSDFIEVETLVAAHCIEFPATYRGAMDNALGQEPAGRFKRLIGRIGHGARVFCDRTRQGETVIRIVLGIHGWSSVGGEKLIRVAALSGHPEGGGAILVEQLAPLGERPPGECPRHLEGVWYIFDQYLD